MIIIKSLVLIFLILLIFSSCTIKDVEEKNEEIDIVNTQDVKSKNENTEVYINRRNIANANKISLGEVTLEEETFDSYYITKPNDKEAWIGDYHMEFDHVFYVISYTKDMEQWPYKVELHEKNMSTDEDEIIYQTSDEYKILSIGNLRCTPEYIFWVERRVNKENIETYICKMDLQSREVCEIRKMILNNTSFNEFSLSISDEFLTWYETDYNENSINVKGMIYNHKNDELSILPVENIIFTTPADAALNITDGGLTFFTKDEAGTLYINRYDLYSKEKTSILLEGDVNVTTNSMSNREWIVWFERATKQRIYMHNINENKLYSINENSDMNIYSFFLKGRKLFLNIDMPNCKLIKVDLDSMEVLGYKLSAQENLSTFSSYFEAQLDGLLYISTEDEKGKKIIIVE